MIKPHPDIETNSYISIATIIDRLSISRSTLDRLRASKDFPEPSLYFGKHPRWSTSVINAWLAGKVQATDT